MVATVQITEANGTTATYTVKSSSTGSTGVIRFRRADTQVVDTSSPMVIGGVKYSFIKMIRPLIATAPDTQISNFLGYSDGSATTEAGLKFWLSTAATTSYVTPVTPSTGNDPARTPGTTNTAFQNMFNFVSTAAWDLSTAVISSTETFPYRTGLKFTMLLLEVESTGSPVQGTHPPSTGPTEKWTISYDEI